MALDLKNDMPDLSSDSDSSEEWEETEENSAVESVLCLFCSERNTSVEESMTHCKKIHNFDMVSHIQTLKLNYYLYIKLVNFIRKTKVSSDELKSLSDNEWKLDKYLVPTLQDDPWLMFDIEDIEMESEEILENHNQQNLLNDSLSTSSSEMEILKLKQELAVKDEMLKKCEESIQKMRTAMHNILNEDKAPTNMKVGSDVTERKNYFESYSGYGIHHEMLSDEVRTLSYHNAVVGNRNQIEDKLVLDLGCGTGILSMFAAEAAARKVYAVDNSDIIYYAMDIIRENNMENKIDLIKGQIENTQLPVEKVDVIVSEWMGYFLLFEGMLDSFLYARDKYLKPEGLLLPNSCSISIVGIENKDLHSSLVDFWSNVYGYKMNCFKKEIIKEPIIQTVDQNCTITDPATVLMLDLYKCCKDSLEFSSPFSLICQNEGELSALVGYFDVSFDLENAIHFSTGPHSKPTHWKQTVFLLPESIKVQKGQKLVGNLVCQRIKEDRGSLKITILIEQQELCYELR